MRLSVSLLFYLLLMLAIASSGWTQSDRSAKLEGQVIGEQGSVAKARVRYQGECSFVVSNADGKFHLPAPKDKQARVTAWKEGYGIAASSLDNVPLRLKLVTLPLEDNPDYDWIDPALNKNQPNNCGNCHPEIFDEWRNGGHGSAATNRRFLSLFAGTDWHGKPSPKWNVLQEHPLGSAVCANCHAPTFSDPTLDYDMRKVTGVAAKGVHCDYCHKVVDVDAKNAGTLFGRDGMTLLRPRKGKQLSFGPLEDAVREGETFGYVPLYKESKYCASCHEGVIFGTHVYGTYSEWLESPARQKGQQCQTCHMAPTGKMTNIAPGHGGVERNAMTLGSHHFPGGTVEMLKRSVSVKVQAAKKGNKTVVSITVLASNAGHRVPTGFIDRHLVLVVKAFDKHNNAIALIEGSRLPDAAGKKLKDVPGRLYGKLLFDKQGNAPIPFWLPHDKAVDTRLKPNEPDREKFVFRDRVRRLRVRLIYRRFWQDVIESKRWPDNQIVVFDLTQFVK